MKFEKGDLVIINPKFINEVTTGNSDENKVCPIKIGEPFVVLSIPSNPTNFSDGEWETYGENWYTITPTKKTTRKVNIYVLEEEITKIKQRALIYIKKEGK